MPTEVEVPDFGIVEFPDGMSVPEMEAAILTKLHQEPKRKALAAEKQDLIQQRKVGDIVEKGIGMLERGLEPLSPSGILNQPARLAGEADPFQAGKPAIYEIPKPKGSGVIAGVGRAGANLVNAIQTPEGLVTLPLAPVSGPLRALFAGDIVRHLPETVAESAKVLGDIESTPADITEAVLNPAAQTGLAGLILKTPRPISQLTGKPIGPLSEVPFSGATIKTPKGAAKPRQEWMEEDPGVVIDGPEPTPGEIIQKSVEREPLTEEIPNAIQPESAQVLRTVQEKPVEGEGQVPVAGDVVEAGQPRSEAQLPTEEAIKPAATTEEVLGTKPAEPPPADVVPAPEAPKTATSIKNAVVDKERIDRGLPPLMDAARRELDVAWDEAMAKIEGDQSYPERLVAELAKNRRPITDTEVSALLHRKIELRNEHSKASDQLIEAAESGNSVAYADAKSRLSDVSDKLLQIDEVGKAVGTEQSRGLNARKILADEDFTRVKMEIDRRVARGGGRLSPSEMTEIVRMQAIIDKTQKAYEKAEQRIIDLEVAKLAAEASKGAKIDPGTQALVDRIIVGLDKEASAARNRIKARSEELRFSAGPLGELPNIKDYAIIGASHIVKGAVEFSRWSAKMVEEFGKGIEPHLKSIFEASNKHLDEKAASPTVAGKPVAKAVADKSASALKAYKTRMKNQREEYDRRIREGDFQKKVRKKIAMDPEAVRAKYAADKAKGAWMDLLFKEKMAQRTKLQKVFGGLGEAANTSRSILTSLDLSAVLRQGGFISMARPIRSAKIFPDMFRAMGLTPGTTVAGAKAAMAELVRGHPIRAAIEGVKTMGELGRMAEHAINVEIMSRENYPLYKQSNLYLSEHGKSLSKMEEVYMSRWADKIPMVAGSQRAYTTFLNRLRADSFDAMVKGLSKDGNIDSAQANAISNFINVSTGRGIYGEHSKNVESAMNVLNTVFFAPRYVTSRFQVLAGQPFYKGGKGTRKMIAGEYGRFLLSVGVVYALAEAAGASVNYTDPTKSDFTKIRFGNTLMDPMAGLQQQTVFTSREAEQLIKTIRGEKRKWNEKNGAQILGKYLRTKLAPVPGAIVDLSTGSNVAGEPVTLTSAATGLVTPIQVEDILEAMQEQGIPRGIGLGLLSMMGVGMQTYSQVKKK